MFGELDMSIYYRPREFTEYLIILICQFDGEQFSLINKRRCGRFQPVYCLLVDNVCYHHNTIFVY